MATTQINTNNPAFEAMQTAAKGFTYQMVTPKACVALYRIARDIVVNNVNLDDFSHKNNMVIRDIYHKHGMNVNLENITRVAHLVTIYGRTINLMDSGMSSR